jgi:Fuc2NAc and GlcNAc transferase
MDTQLALILMGCALLSLSLAHLYRMVSMASDIVDSPNHRSAHSTPTPSGAGISFVIVSVLAILLVSYVNQLPLVSYLPLLPALLIAAVGFADDLKPTSWRLRLLVQLAAAASVMMWIDFPQFPIYGLSLSAGFLGGALGVFALLLITNVYNFMDGIDGIAISEAVFVCGAVIVLTGFGGDSLPLQVLLAASAGFLFINFPPAKVFMGDAGSGFLGFVFGVFILQELAVPLWTWLILLAGFLADGSLTLVARLCRKEPIQQAHSQHGYQHLNRRVGTRTTLLIMHVVNLFILLPLAWLSLRYEAMAFFLVGLTYTALWVALYYVGAGQSETRLDIANEH